MVKSQRAVSHRLDVRIKYGRKQSSIRGRNRRAQHTSRPVPTGLPGHTISEARSEPCSNYPGWAEFPNNINHLWVYASMLVQPVLSLIGGVRAGRPARKKHVLRQRPSRCPAPEQSADTAPERGRPNRLRSLAGRTRSIRNSNAGVRSEERRVGKEGRSRWST